MICDAAILAGGRAERMGGQPKGLLRVAGLSIVERQVAALREAAREVLLVLADESTRDLYAGLGVRVVLDRMPGLGPLAGIDAALDAATSDSLLIVGCDLPLLDGGLLALVRDHAPEAQVVVPRLAGRPQALHARWHRSALASVRKRLASRELPLLPILDQLRTVYLDEPELRAAARHPDLRGLTNVNTPEDLRRAEALARS
jgi:molybdopterin-guanine dinucleotide biosynthesis protein A